MCPKLVECATVPGADFQIWVAGLVEECRSNRPEDCLLLDLLLLVLAQMHCLSTNLILCRCSNNQFRLSANDDEDLFTTFRTRLQRIGNVIALLDTWKCPYYLSRKWCKLTSAFRFFFSASHMKLDTVGWQCRHLRVI